MIDDRRRTTRALIAVPLAVLFGIAAVGCGSTVTGTLSAIGSAAASDEVGPIDEASSGIDQPVDEESPFGELPTLAPVPDSVKAGAACDKAYRVWMDWWQASVEVVDPDNPDASVSAIPAGDPDKIERAVFDKCSLIDIAAANRDHLITLDPDEGQVPFIDTDVIWFLAGMCEDDVDLIGDSALCQAVPSPAP